MLIRHYIIFVFRVRRLVLRRDVDEFFGEVGGAVEFFEEVGVAGGGEVNVGVGRIFGLFGGDGVSGCAGRMRRAGTPTIMKSEVEGLGIRYRRVYK